MLRTHSPVRALTMADRDQALEVCARDIRTNVFVAARILELIVEPFHIEGRRMFVSSIIGIALSTTASTPDYLLRNLLDFRLRMAE